MIQHTVKQNNKIALRARKISMSLLFFLILLIGIVVSIAIRGISYDNAMNIARSFSIEAANKFSYYISQDLALVRKTALSKAITNWFADEENETERAIAFDEMADYADLFHGVHLYFGIEETYNEYSIKDKAVAEEFVPFDRLNRLNPVDKWYFECINSPNDYSLKVDVEKRTGMWQLWINHKVMVDGKLEGVFASGLVIPDMFEEIFEGFGEHKVKGFVVNNEGIIQTSSTSLEIYIEEYKDNDFMHISTESTDPRFAESFALYKNRISGFYTPHLPPEIIRLSKGQYDYAAIKPIDNTDWSVVVFYKHNILSGINALLPLLVILAAALLLYVMALDILMRRNFFTPLNQLVQNISESDASATALIGKNRDDEIGELAQTIQGMWGRLSNFNSTLLQSTLERKRQEELLSSINNIAAVLLESADKDDFLASVQDGLGIIGYILEADRVQIWQNETINGELYFLLEHEWLSEAGKQAVPFPFNIKFPYSERPEWEEKFHKGENINGPLTSLLPEDQAFFKTYNIQSIAIIPLFIQNQFWGYFSINDCRAERTLTEGEIDILRSGSLMMVSAMLRNEQSVQIRDAHERTQLLINSMPFAIHLWGRDGRMVDCNEAALRQYNINSKQEYITNYFHFLSPEYQPDGQLSAEKATMINKKVFDDGNNIVFEWVRQAPDGTLVPIEVTSVRVKYEDDYVVVSYSRDLSEYKQMMAEIEKKTEELAFQSHWYKSILDATPLPISVTDADMNWTFVNRSALDFLGTKFEDMIGKPCSNWNANICNTPDCGIACAKRGLNRTYFNHEGASYQVDVGTLKGMEGEVAGFIEVLQDITKLKEMEKEALTASKAKSQFLANMSHEMRTPMNAILGIAEIQLQDRELVSKTREALEKIYNSGDLLLNIINEILDLSKIETGKLEVTPSRYKIASLIHDTVTLNMMRIGSKRIEFKLSVDENTPSVLFGDELRIKQVLNNLLSNAFKYTKEGEVKLSIYHEEGSVKTTGENNEAGVNIVFAVSDTGQGMTEEQVSKLFDEYTRFNLDVNRTIEGAGLGMNITRNLIQLMNGEISVESEINKGSVFTVRLPQGCPEDEVLGSELAENLEKFRESGTKQIKRAQVVFEPMPYGSVLVVDDVESNLYVANGLLAPYGLAVETVMSGFEAVDRIKNGTVYDIVFMDHMMPKMDGIEATKIIRGMGYMQPIIALTANAVVGQSEVFLENGFDGFISKPIDIRQMNVMLKKFVRDRQPPEVIEAALRQQAAGKELAGPERESINPQLAEIFVRDARKAITVLEGILGSGSYKDEDIRLFTINVHAMKSALANVGDTELSAAASQLEQAGHEKNTAVIAEKTPVFLDELRKTAERLGQQQGHDADHKIMDENAEEVRSYLNEKLQLIKKACGVYDKKTAKNTIAELRQKAWTQATKELLGLMDEHLLNGDFDDVSDTADKILEKINT